MSIICLAEMSKLISLKKKKIKMPSAAVVIGALRANTIDTENTKYKKTDVVCVLEIQLTGFQS